MPAQVEIRVSDATREALRSLKRSGETWDALLRRLARLRDKALEVTGMLLGRADILLTPKEWETIHELRELAR